MRTIKVNYPGLEEFDVQIALGEKAVKVKALLKGIGESEEKTLDIMCEIVSLVTKFKKEEVAENLTEMEMTDIVFMAQGDLEAIKKVQRLTRAE